MKANSKVKGRKPLTQDLLREYLRYCESGHLVWNKRPWSKSTAKVGDKVGSLRIYIGKFNCEIEAAKAYDNTVREYHKEFQKVNINDFS